MKYVTVYGRNGMINEYNDYHDYNDYHENVY